MGNGSSLFLGDIALDDISFSLGCGGIAPTPPPPPYFGTDCTFETGFCDWVNDLDADWPWTRAQGATPSSNTGPVAGDHTFGNSQGIKLELYRHDQDKHVEGLTHGGRTDWQT